MKFTGERMIPGTKECGSNSHLYVEHIKRYEFAVSKIKPHSIILDLACGSGYGTKLLGKKAKFVQGGDIDPDTIQYANDIYKDDNILFNVFDCINTQLPDNYFDCVVSFETIEHIPDYASFISEVYRVLKPDGTFILSTPNKFLTNGINEFHVREFSLSEILYALEPCFGNFTTWCQRPFELFNNLSKKLHIRSIVKILRRKSYFNVRKYDGIESHALYYIITCTKK